MPEVRLIDANALKAKLNIGANTAAYSDYCSGYFDARQVDLDAIDAAPTIEPEVRHGRFVFQKGDNKETVDGWICTACKYGFHTKVPYFEVFNYCPMCGARMDGGADNG